MEIINVDGIGQRKLLDGVTAPQVGAAFYDVCVAVSGFAGDNFGVALPSGQLAAAGRQLVGRQRRNAGTVIAP